MKRANRAGHHEWKSRLSHLFATDRTCCKWGDSKDLRIAANEKKWTKQKGRRCLGYLLDMVSLHSHWRKNLECFRFLQHEIKIKRTAWTCQFTSNLQRMDHFEFHSRSLGGGSKAKFLNSCYSVCESWRDEFEFLGSLAGAFNTKLLLAHKIQSYGSYNHWYTSQSG